MRMTRDGAGPDRPAVVVDDWLDVVTALQPFLARSTDGVVLRLTPGRRTVPGSLRVVGTATARGRRVDLRLDDPRFLTRRAEADRLRRLAGCLAAWDLDVTVAAGDVVQMVRPGRRLLSLGGAR